MVPSSLVLRREEGIFCANRKKYFALRSVFRNIDFVEVNFRSEKLKYIWFFARFFVTLP